MNLKFRWVILLAFSIILVTSAYKPIISFMFSNQARQGSDSSVELRKSLRGEVTGTTLVNLPIIEGNSIQNTVEPVEGYPATVNTTPGTPTPPPIPPQSGSVNIPIVIGAFAIILVVVMSWFFIYYLPNKRRRS